MAKQFSATVAKPKGDEGFSRVREINGLLRDLDLAERVAASIHDPAVAMPPGPFHGFAANLFSYTQDRRLVFDVERNPDKSPVVTAGADGKPTVTPKHTSVWANPVLAKAYASTLSQLARQLRMELHALNSKS